MRVRSVGPVPAGKPVQRTAERVPGQTRRPPLGLSGAHHQARLLQDPKMPGDGGETDREGPGERGDRGLTLGEAMARRVGSASAAKIAEGALSSVDGGKRRGVGAGAVIEESPLADYGQTFQRWTKG